MRGRAVTVGALLVAAVGVVAPAQSQGEEPAERERLTGTWQGFVVAGRGERTDRGPVKITEVVITAETIRARDDRMSFGEGEYRLDLARSPRRLDSSGISGDVKGREFTGIYTLEGDTLRWCVANPGKPRPTEYRTQVGVQFYLVLRRVPKAHEPGGCVPPQKPV